MVWTSENFIIECGLVLHTIREVLKKFVVAMALPMHKVAPP